MAACRYAYQSDRLYLDDLAAIVSAPSGRSSFRYLYILRLLKEAQPRERERELSQKVNRDQQIRHLGADFGRPLNGSQWADTLVRPYNLCSMGLFRQPPLFLLAASFFLADSSK